MLAGHFTTALIAKQRFPKGTLLYFLIISQLQDFLWFVFHYLGIEPTSPSDAFDATLSNMAVDMVYSHDLLPLLIWLLIAFTLGKIWALTGMQERLSPMTTNYPQRHE